MKASTAPIFVVLIAIAGIFFYGYIYLVLPERNTFEKIQKDYSKEQKDLRRLLLIHRDSLGKGKNGIQNEEIEERMDSMIHYYLRDSLKFHH